MAPTPVRARRNRKGSRRRECDSPSADTSGCSRELPDSSPRHPAMSDRALRQPPQTSRHVQPSSSTAPSDIPRCPKSFLKRSFRHPRMSPGAPKEILQTSRDVSRAHRAQFWHSDCCHIVAVDPATTSRDRAPRHTASEGHLHRGSRTSTGVRLRLRSSLQAAGSPARPYTSRRRAASPWGARRAAPRWATRRFRRWG